MHYFFISPLLQGAHGHNTILATTILVHNELDPAQKPCKVHDQTANLPVSPIPPVDISNLRKIYSWY